MLLIRAPIPVMTECKRRLDVLGNAGFGRQRLSLPLWQRWVVVDLGEAVKRGKGSLQVA